MNEQQPTRDREQVRSLFRHVGAAVGQVENRGDEEQPGDEPYQRAHTARAIRSPRGDDEPDGQRHRERADLVRDVLGSMVIAPEQQQRRRDPGLRDRDRDQPDARERNRAWSTGWTTASKYRGNQRVGGDRHRPRRLQPGVPGHFVCRRTPRSARGAGVQVLVERPLIDRGCLVVEQRRDRFPRGFAVHTFIVDREAAEVPDPPGTAGWPPTPGRAYGVGVDELTRLAHAARRAVPGSVDAFIRASHEPVWRLCEALVDTQTADDLTQETFIKAVGALRRFRGDASARTWILSIARHTCMDELRVRSRRQRRSTAMHAAPTDGLRIPDPGEEIGARDLLAHLEADRRAAFTLTQLLGLSYEEAAETCGCPIGTIRSRVARARSDLIDMLGRANPAETTCEGYGPHVTPARAPHDRRPRTQ